MHNLEVYLICYWVFELLALKINIADVNIIILIDLKFYFFIITTTNEILFTLRFSTVLPNFHEGLTEL